MKRGTRKWTEEVILKRELEGLGKGTKESYRPWVDLHDFSSDGNTHRFQGAYIKRDYLLFSDLEFNAFTLCEWSQRYSDIREQMPLDRELTRAIAAELGIPHPTYRGTDVPFVMTTDLVLTDALDEQKNYAVNVKPASAFKDPRQLELLEIQRFYYAGMGVPHQIYVLTQPAIETAKTILWSRAAYVMDDGEEPYEGCYQEHAAVLESQLAASDGDFPLATFCDFYDSKCRLPKGTALNLARRAIFARRLSIPLDSRTPAQTPLFLISASTSSSDALFTDVPL